jgi:hypothetical protein
VDYEDEGDIEPKPRSERGPFQILALDIIHTICSFILVTISIALRAVHMFIVALTALTMLATLPLVAFAAIVLSDRVSDAIRYLWHRLEYWTWFCLLLFAACLACKKLRELINKGEEEEDEEEKLAAVPFRTPIFHATMRPGREHL